MGYSSWGLALSRISWPYGLGQPCYSLVPTEKETKGRGSELQPGFQERFFSMCVGVLEIGFFTNLLCRGFAFESGARPSAQSF